MAWNKHTWQDKYFGKDKEEEASRRMGDRKISFQDKEGRKINISAGYGLQVEDANETIIHDTPDCVIASDMIYGGHLYFKNTPNYVDSSTFNNESDGGASESIYSTLHNLDLTNYLPSDITNARAALFSLYHEINIDNDCVKDITVGLVETHYCQTYNSSADSSYNWMGGLTIRSQSAEADSNNLRHSVRTQAVVPIVYSGDTPYVTWWSWYALSGLTTSTGNDELGSVILYFQGFYV